MRPQEEARARDAVEPTDRIRHDLIRSPLPSADPGRALAGVLGRAPVGTSGSNATVAVEPMREAALRPQHDRFHECAGVEAAIVQHLGERRVAGGQRFVRVVADAVSRRKQPGEEARVRRKRQRRDRRRLVEDDTLARQPVERRHRRAHEAVHRQPIGACRVERDDDDVQGTGRTKRRTPPESGQERARDEQQRPGSEAPAHRVNSKRWPLDMHEAIRSNRGGPPRVSSVPLNVPERRELEPVRTTDPNISK